MANRVKIGLFFFFAFAVFCSERLYAQEEAIQLSGIVLTGDSLYGVPRANVYVAGTARGTVTNPYGYFSFAVLPGDTVTVSAVGFKTYKYFVKPSEKKTLSEIIVLIPDIIMLPEVTALPYRTEREFKDAFMALKIPQTDFEAMKKNLDPDMMAELFRDTGMDGGTNHTAFMQDQMYKSSNRFINPMWANPLLNPFAWARFIKDIKEGKLKRKKSR